MFESFHQVVGDFVAMEGETVVDVPRFELGNRNAERIRCFILGFQVAQRLAAWKNTRYGGGL